VKRSLGEGGGRPAIAGLEVTGKAEIYYQHMIRRGEQEAKYICTGPGGGGYCGFTTYFKSKKKEGGGKGGVRGEWAGGVGRKKSVLMTWEKQKQRAREGKERGSAALFFCEL